MLGGDGKVGEIDGEIRGLLVPRQSVSALPLPSGRGAGAESRATRTRAKILEVPFK